MFDELPMIIDSFAGGGGASTGIERALGRSPDVAINHNEAALALHAANHPDTLHLDNNIWDVDPATVAKGRKVGLLWASPDCKHFSKAKGGAPKDRNIRDLAWVIVKWAQEVKPDVILMENVEEFKTWGPLCDEGKVIKGLEGVIFDDWVSHLRKAGYKIAWRELRGCDYGAPTIRKRFFMVARRDGRKIVWPKPTHGDPATKEVMSGKLKPWRTAAECIDWSRPCPSIFDTKAEIKEKHKLQAVRPLAKNTMARAARGLKRYVLDAQRPFIVNLTHGARLEDAAQPLRTITGANRGEKAVVAPALATYYGHAGGRSVRNADLKEPLRTITTENRHALLAPSITRFNGGATGQDMRTPMSTVTANSWIKKPGGATPLGMIAPHIATMRNAQKPFNGADEPTHTITAGGAGLSLIAPSLLSLKGTDRRDSTVTVPHPTVLAGGGHSAIISPILTYAQHGGQVRDPLDPMHTICASRKDQNAALVPLLVQTGYGERKGQQPRALDPHSPIGTIVAGGGKHAPAAAFLAQHNSARQGFNPGRPVTTPLSTVTGTGAQQNVVASFFAKYYGTGDGARTSDPLHTITANDRFGHIQSDLTHAPQFGPEHERKARMVADLMREHGYWDEREFVTLEIDAETFVIVDVGMRMLTPRELFNAQGFPSDYVIEGVWDHDTETDDWTWRAFPKDVQISCVGNSVCPDLAEALASANCQHLIEQEQAA